MEPIIKKITVPQGARRTAADILVAESGLPKARIKDAMNKGAVWMQRGAAKPNRLRKVTALTKPGDRLEMYYDAEVLSKKPPPAQCISDQVHYSVWFKPPGLLAQGTMYGDHCSIMRQAEVFFGMKREIYLVHRLDREASGLMLLAHSSRAAAALSEVFRNNRITKTYSTEVRGNLPATSPRGTIELPLDGKPAVTEYEAEAYDAEKDISRVKVIIRTGRLHQIRRHFEMIGFPVIGDPRYGRKNKNSSGMRLQAVSLSFRCPILRKDVAYRIPGD
ncbi:MAG: RluA family pseudouridine synthase [Nitrospiraceae bacterium]|nr:RluA family pseudouridine synthase [Nitrospiraceae bacterium]